MKTQRLLFLTIISILFSGMSLNAELKLHRFFTDHMVLQRDQPVLIKGTDRPGEKVTIEFYGQSKSTAVGQDGMWAVTLAPLSATSKGLSLTCKGSETITLKNVVVGDLWLWAQQAYVNITLGRDDEGKKAAQRYSPNPNFRAITIRTIPAKTPQSDFDGAASSGWTQVDQVSALGMSAPAFYLGAKLSTEVGVPVGLIDVNMDRYFGIGWLSDKAISESVERFPNDKELSWLPNWMRERADARDNGQAQKDLDAYVEAQTKKSRGRKVKRPSLGLHPIMNPMYPSAGYNAVIHPLKNISMKGVLLQLGNDYPFVAYRDLDSNGTATVTAELDAAWQENYMILKSGYRVTEKTLPYVPEDWRRTLGNEALPIALMLPPSSGLDTYAAHNREIRELHRRTSERLDGVSLILPGNENRPSSGQVKDEKLLADRSLKWIKGITENSKLISTGPLLDRVEARLSKATIYFKDGTAEGLKASAEALQMFETAAPDLVFTKASATVDGSVIRLKSDSPIQFVRFDYSTSPSQGLTNSSGLPAPSFNTDVNWTFGWIPPTLQANLPKEYQTTADKWGESNVAIINGQIANMAIGDSEPIPRRPGPLGIVASPFGPNIYVVSTEPNTPASGNLQEGDVIYGIGGTVFSSGLDVSKDHPYEALSAAITESETEAGKGKLVLNIRRDGKLMDVELKMKILGSYSSTTPYYCEKSENIVKNAIAWSTDRYRPERGMASQPMGKLYTDLLFLLAANDPAHQGIVRRAIYSIMDKMKPVPVTKGMQSKPWSTGYLSTVLGEYYSVTGDRNVLPYLKYQADLSAQSQLKPIVETPDDKEAAQSEMQVGGWRQNYPGNPERWKSGYGLMPHAGMLCTMGMLLSKEAGNEVDELALQRGIDHHYIGRAQYGFVLYSYGSLRREGPPTISPQREAIGGLWSMNGKLGTAAALYDMVGKRDAVDISARHCVYGYNRTRSGHGGMFFNNFWTPIGAWAAREHAFKHFMKGQMWWRELFRKNDGSFNQVGRGGIGVSYALPYAAHHQRLRMLGAPVSPFGTNCPEYLKPALLAHQGKEYEECERLISDVMNSMIIPADDRPVVDKFLKEVQILRASIDHDLSLTEKLITAGKYYYASLELPQLKGVIHSENSRLKSILSQLESTEGKAKIAAHRSECENLQRELTATKKAQRKTKTQRWSRIQPEGNTWKMKVVESTGYAPNGWTQSSFQDSDWNTASLPISWTMYHTALFRGSFNIKNKDELTGLRIFGKFFQQANVVVHLNGKTVAKIDEIGRGAGQTLAPLNDYGMSLLKNGENVISLSSRHKRRWGSYRGTYKTASTVDFRVEVTKD